MKGIFIPEITVEMFRNGCFEAIEELMAEGEIYDIEYDPKTAEPEPHWIPTIKEHPPQHQEIWITDVYGDVEVVYRGDGILWHSNGDNGYYFEDEIIAWMPASVPEPYQPEGE